MFSLANQSILLSYVPESAETPFTIIHNYRKTKQLKKARELRKHKIELIKKEQQRALQEVRH
jgi:hypothetical protein